MESNLYVDLWVKVLPVILHFIKNGGGSLNLKPELFESAGNRKSSGYGFRLDIVNMDVPKKSNSAVARDLKYVLDSNSEFKQLSKGKTIVIRMGRNFDFHVIL